MEKSTIIILIIVLLAVVFFVFKPTLTTGASSLLSVRLYDANKNPIQTFAIVNGINNVAYADFTATLENKGNRKLTCHFVDILPSSFDTAFFDHSVNNPQRQYIVLESGEKKTVTSTLVDLTPFEPTVSGAPVPIEFSLKVSCSYAEGVLERFGKIVLNIQKEDFPNPELIVSINDSLGSGSSNLWKCASGSASLVPAGQVLYFAFNNEQVYGESLTVAHDFSGNNFNGAVSNAAFDSTGGKFGDGAYLFNGVNSLISVPDQPQFSPANYGQKMTVTFWMRVDTWNFVGGTDSSDKASIHVIGKYNPSNAREWYFRVQNATAFDSTSRAKRISFYVFSPTQGLGVGSYFQPGVNGDTDIAAGEWVFVAGVINGTHTKIYKNGVFRDADPLTNYNITMGDASAPLTIGRYSSDYKDFQGEIDELRIFNRALSDAEITQLYNLNSCTYT